MGNKKNDDVKEAKKGCLVLIALSVLILLVTMMSMFLQLVPLVVPAVFLILLIVNWYHYRKEDRPHLRNGFWLSEDDMDRYSLVSTVLETEKNNRNAVQAAVKNEGIHINQNGRISARSYRGKNLRNTLENANATIDEYLPVKIYLEGLPQERWKSARKHYSKYKGFLLAVIVWVFFMLFTTSDTINGFKQYVKGVGSTGGAGVSMVVDLWDDLLSNSTEDSTVAKSENQQKATTEEDKNKKEESGMGALVDNFGTEFAGSLWKALILMVVVYFVMRFIIMFVFSSKYKKPPFVDMTNVFEYNVCYVDKPRRRQRKSSRQRVTEEDDNVENTETPITQLSDLRHIETPQRTEENEVFALWADRLKQNGYAVGGNWVDWNNSGDWKNLTVPLTVAGIRVHGTIEYYVKGKQLYYGIQKADENDKVSQTLLNSDAFKTMMNDFGMSVKNNEWWYCLKHVSFEDAFSQYKNFIDIINKLSS